MVIKMKVNFRKTIFPKTHKLNPNMEENRILSSCLKMAEILTLMHLGYFLDRTTAISMDLHLSNKKN